MDPNFSIEGILVEYGEGSDFVFSDMRDVNIALACFRNAFRSSRGDADGFSDGQDKV